MRRLILRGNECFEVDEECLRKKKMQGEECVHCKKNEKGKDDRWNSRKKRGR